MDPEVCCCLALIFPDTVDCKGDRVHFCFLTTFFLIRNFNYFLLQVIETTKDLKDLKEKTMC